MPYRKALRQYRKKKSEEFIPDSASDPTSDDYAPMGEPEESDDEIWLRSVKDDPYQFVLDAFPWGEPHNDLAAHEGPDEWQASLLKAIRDGLLDLTSAVHMARASGHGCGKSALVAWIILWGMSTMQDTRIVVTANTEVQLRTKTWPELGRWHRMSRVRSMFTFMATALYSSNKEYEKTWRCDAITWSEARPEAFAGLHNQGKRIVIIFDEASWIPDIIWETTEGALTDKDTQIIWCAFGNPTRNTGRFRECFNRFRDRWNHEQIDSRTVRISNKDQLKRWQTDYGEDSDFFRVRVRGQFPRVSSMQFIPTQLAEDAMKSDREVEVTWMDPLIIGVDVARYGDNRSVICFRRGRDARTIPWIVLQGVNTMTLAGRVAQLALELKPDAIFVDEGGVGGGVVDRLQMLHIPCIPVNFGAHADYAVPSVDGRVTYRNKATEMWGSLRSWLPGGMIPNDPDLLDELISREYGFTTIDGKDAIVLESKMDMRSRNVVSPDKSDAIALTFAFPVGLSDHRAQLTGKPTHQFDYDPMATAYQAR